MNNRLFFYAMSVNALLLVLCVAGLGMLHSVCAAWVLGSLGFLFVAIVLAGIAGFFDRTW